MELTLFTAMETSMSGLKAQRYRMNIIAENLANVHTTHTDTGEPYRRKEVLFATKDAIPIFADIPNKAFEKYLRLTNAFSYSRGVHVTGVIEDETPLREVYDPGHPDADEKGIVRLPNVNPLIEMVNMMSTARSYESNITAINSAKRMAQKALEIGN